jgi:periplasmic glucans biosynthesis protein
MLRISIQGSLFHIPRGRFLPVRAPLLCVRRVWDGAAISRRRVYGASLAVLGFWVTVFLLILPFPAIAQNTMPTFLPSSLSEGSRFSPSLVTDAARQLAKKPFQPIPSDLPEPFNALTFEAYSSIKGLPSGQLWRKEKGSGEKEGIVIEPLHRGFAFTHPVSLFYVEEGTLRRMPFSTAAFDYSKLIESGKTLPATLPDLQFSGFKVLTGPDRQDTFTFQGASFFRAIGLDQTYGQMARALTIRPADARGEEFPLFRAFWIEKPSTADTQLIVHALIDSESASAAARFTLRPNGVTVIDVELTLFPRVSLDHIGIGGMAGSFLFGRQGRRIGDDIRNGAYEVSGLAIHTGKGEWLYRPVTNPDTLLISVFSDENPKGFGLVQRDRAYTDFHDDTQQWHKRPSVWIEPIGDWGNGAVQMLEIPSDSENNDNILAYWRPKTPYAAGSEITIAYRQFWSKQPPDYPPLAQAMTTRTGKITGTRKRRFTVDFVGDVFANTSLPADMRPSLWSNNGSLSPTRLWHTPDQKTLRVGFDLDPGTETNTELRLLLEARDKALSEKAEGDKPVGDVWKPLSETWLYRWTP